MSKKNRVCFYPNEAIGDEVLKKLEELRFKVVCKGCPISEIGGFPSCKGTSFYPMRTAFCEGSKIGFFKYAKKMLEELKEIKSERDKKQEVIECPLEMEQNLGKGDGLGIPFNDKKQVLWYSTNTSVYKILSCYQPDLIPCNLVPVNKNDLEVGSTYFHCDEPIDYSKNKLEYYCKYLGEGKYVWPDPYEGVTVSDFSLKHWYKVVPRGK